MDFKLTNRYILKGILRMKTGLHIGGGKDTSSTDNPVIRDSYDKPFIPGSSFKGVLRTRVEKLIPVLESISGVWSCQFFTESNGNKECLSMLKNQKKITKLFEEAAGRKRFCESVVLSKIYKEKYGLKQITERFILEEYLDENLCDTCKLFGSPVFGSKIKVSDLHICEPYFEMSEIRDGVAINRDSEIAVEQAKYDYEIIPSQSEFELNITLESVTQRELAIFALGIREFVFGNVSIGGLSSRGLGACELEIKGIQYVNFTDNSHIEKYLIYGSMPDSLSEEELFNTIKVKLLTKNGGDSDAEANS